MSESTLTLEKLQEVIDAMGILPRQPSLFDALIKPLPTVMGMKVYQREQIPRIQVRDIKLRDGTSILSPEFRSEMNAWFAERFGFYDPLGNDIYMIGNYGISVRSDQMALLRNCSIT